MPCIKDPSLSAVSMTMALLTSSSKPFVVEFSHNDGTFGTYIRAGIDHPCIQSLRSNAFEPLWCLMSSVHTL